MTELDQAPPIPATQDPPPSAPNGNQPPAAQPMDKPAHGWHAQYPKEFWEELKGYEKPEAFLKDFKAQKERAAKALQMPEKDEEWSALYERLGRPKTPADYKLERDKDLKYSDEAEKAFREQAHKDGLTQKQAEAIWKRDSERAKAARAARQAELEAKTKADQEALRKAWGPKYDENVALTTQAIQKLNLQRLPQALAATGMSTDPEVLNLLLMVHKLTTDGNIVTGGTISGSGDPLADRYPNTRIK